MVRILDVFGVIISSIVSFFSFVLGGFDSLLITLIWFSVIDYLSGVLSAIYSGKLCSKIGFKGIIKKLGIYIVVSVSFFLNEYIGIPAIREVVIMFFIANEGISILENLTEMGITAPEMVFNSLKKIENENSKKENEENE